MTHSLCDIVYLSFAFIRLFLHQNGENLYVAIEGPLYFSISAYGTVTTNQGALIIGGYDDSLLRYVATVACYNSVGWSKLDDLQSVRGYHRAIINGDKVYVVGGAHTK